MAAPAHADHTAHDDHGHEHQQRDRPVERVSRRPLAIAFAITATFLIVEVIGGLVTGSLALLADAGHMATDAAALALSLFAVWLARRPATPERSFGYLRAEVLAALVNAGSLVAISIYIFYEAFQRIGEPPEVESGPMLVVAVLGLLANAASAWVLMRGGGHTENLNTRGAFLHVIGDMLGSVGAILAAVVMLLTGWFLADPILSAGIGLLILWSSWKLLRESVDVLLEAAPAEIDLAAVQAAMQRVPGVHDVHDLHIWTVSSGLIALSGHIETSETREWHDVLLELAGRLRDEFGIVHITLQPEVPQRLPDAFRSCSIDTPDGRAACQIPRSTRTSTPGSQVGHRH